ncbi:hypothetical protein CAPTEDRAFT_211871 [Capitella teleta]|uniref:Uncharacterized protein n=1 Tax=Capitella teleta TaxID=283909 RepID=R7VEV0_CAPTE|nr:hypothetical protein CAPTEDRAFT_211871 [Capitella teleta]|eukprot:ELU14826.1 hypothetical protein CAPTEDRAFT_211871 [Capitella teleta]
MAQDASVAYEQRFQTSEILSPSMSFSIIRMCGKCELSKRKFAEEEIREEERGRREEEKGRQKQKEERELREEEERVQREEEERRQKEVDDRKLIEEEERVQREEEDRRQKEVEDRKLREVLSCISSERYLNHPTYVKNNEILSMSIQKVTTRPHGEVQIREAIPSDPESIPTSMPWSLGTVMHSQGHHFVYRQHGSAFLTERLGTHVELRLQLDESTAKQRDGFNCGIHTLAFLSDALGVSHHLLPPTTGRANLANILYLQE